MQFVADIVGVKILVPKVPEAPALGAAWAAGLYTGFWKDLDELNGLWKVDAVYEPQMSREKADALYADWQRAVERCKYWAKPGEA